jgi:dipeptidyl aminopeptidase/acylaminoacyl peptidase
MMPSPNTGILLAEHICIHYLLIQKWIICAMLGPSKLIYWVDARAAKRPSGNPHIGRPARAVRPGGNIVTDYASFLPVQRLGPGLALSADGTMVACVSDASGQFNLWTHPVTGGAPRQLTFFADQSVRQFAWMPDGSRLAFTADTHGDEKTQVYLISADGSGLTRISDAAGRRYVLAYVSPFSPDGRYLLCCGADRDPAVADVIVYDLAGGPARRLPGIAGRHSYAAAFSPDGRWVLAGSFGANTDFQCHLADLASPEPSLQPVSGHLPGSYYRPGPWEADGSGFFVRTTAGDDDHVCLARISLPDRTMTIVDAPAWDVEEDVTVSADGTTILWTVNQDGRSVLHGRRNGVPIDLPPLPDGVISAPGLSADGSVAALLLDSAARPAEVAVLRLHAGETVRYLTSALPAALTSAPASRPELHHYPARDGTWIPALLYRPRGGGPHPVLMHIHGGPELQARPIYSALFQCLLANGIAVMAPNVRGSAGYGLAWQRRIYLDWGGIDLADLEAGAGYLRALRGIDPERMAVMGASYGGFAALSCLTRLPGLWAAGVSVYGPANLETLARSMPPSWAPTVATMIGDPDKDAGRLRERSPVSYADQITAPLLVIQGVNDPRVPKAEADQIVASARANHAEVEYLEFSDEGHGFTSRNNEIKAHTAVIDFLTKHLR